MCCWNSYFEGVNLWFVFNFVLIFPNFLNVLIFQNILILFLIFKIIFLVIGGHNGVQIFNTVECYDPVLEKWSTVAPMLEPRCRLAAASHQNKIYVVGGFVDFNFFGVTFGPIFFEKFFN